MHAAAMNAHTEHTYLVSSLYSLIDTRKEEEGEEEEEEEVVV